MANTIVLKVTDKHIDRYKENGRRCAIEYVLDDYGISTEEYPVYVHPHKIAESFPTSGKQRQFWLPLFVRKWVRECDDYVSYPDKNPRPYPLTFSFDLTEFNHGA